MTTDAAFRDAIARAGLTPPDRIIADGQLHRFPTNSRPGDDAGWYILHDDGIPAGAFGDWRSGVSQTWSAKAEPQMSAAERAAHRARIEAARRLRAQDEQRRRAEAAAKARAMWEAAAPAQVDHPYLLRKKVGPHGLRVDADGCLLVPIRDAAGDWLSLQLIDARGEKRFLAGGRTAGGYYLIGTVSDTLLLAEGFATAASLREATGLPVAVALCATNLMPVAQALRKTYPHAQIIICADNDKHGVGEMKAREAAAAINGGVVLPDEPGRDWNDVHVAHGLDAVRQGLEGVLHGAGRVSEGREPAPPSDTWPTLDPAALHGLAGDVVRLLEPHTEADPVALLVSFLAEVGCMLGRSPHLILDGAYHPLLVWPVLVGRSSKSRKGSSSKRMQAVLSLADPDWTRGQYRGTLSSGEGLAYAVRDPQYHDTPVKEQGRPTGETVPVCLDPGWRTSACSWCSPSLVRCSASWPATETACPACSATLGTG